MGRLKSVSAVDELTRAQAEADFKQLPDGKIAQRLLAIIAAGHDRRLGEVAEVFRVTRQSVAQWIKAYKASGVSGLTDRPKGHRRKRLSPKQEEIIQGWLERSEDADGAPIHWTAETLQAAIGEAFAIQLGRTRVWQLMHAWGFRLKQPRPRHAKADAAAQEALKKTP
jgi:transposase